MALLVGLLIGLGRLSTDREAVALLACGVSPYRLLRPVLALAGVATAATLYVMIEAIPDANQKYREILFATLSKKVESDVKPRVFFQDFPNWVLYPRNERRAGPAGLEGRPARQHRQARGGRSLHGPARQDRPRPGQAHGRADPERRHQLRHRGPGESSIDSIQADHHPARSGLGLSADRSRPRADREDDRPAARSTSPTRSSRNESTAQRNHGDPRQVLDSRWRAWSSP